MALRSDINKVFSEKSFFNYLETPNSKFRLGALVRVVDDMRIPNGSVGIFVGVVPFKKRMVGGHFLVLVGEKMWHFDGFEIELL